MGISQETHDAITRVELRTLIAVCEECHCDFKCYCAGNAEWARRKLAALDEAKPVHKPKR